MSSYLVRPATVRDAKAIAEINAASSRAAYQGLVPDEHLGTLSIDKRQQFWRDAIEYMEPQVHVATIDGQVIGFVGFDRSRDKGTPSTCGEIWALYVDPAHWNKGVGVALWDAGNDGLKEEGCTKVTVWVPVRNERAMRFFELAGFKREMTTLKTVLVGPVKLEELRLKRDVG
ncbi:GNAT family N-acetyltransferase [Polaromonas sp. UC242_47]|uniref:GNAT family N-acetyltransferase n=1 Tax=Polaromonas sp. UC242_47 TaxID=3374626 RepID=UPI003796FAD2